MTDHYCQTLSTKCPLTISRRDGSSNYYFDDFCSRFFPLNRRYPARKSDTRCMIRRGRGVGGGLIPSLKLKQFLWWGSGCGSVSFLKKWAIPGLSFIYFRLFKQTLQSLQQIKVTNVHPVYGAGIRTHILRYMSLLP